MHQPSKRIYKIVRKKDESANVVTLELASIDGVSPLFISGQYINVFIPENHTFEGKSYSISSIPGSETIEITIKPIGEFSQFLCAMNVGETIEASDPYGYFYSEQNNTPLVFLAAGIGITPIISMIKNILKENSTREMCLHYSNAKIETILFKNELEDLAKHNQSLKVIHYVTQEKDISIEYTVGRIIPKDLQSMQHAEYLICGSISFVRDMWDGLRQNGIKEDYIYTEAFFSH